MRLLDRYLLRELLIPLGYCLGGFLIFWVAFDLVGELGDFQQQDLRVRDIALYYLVRAPEFLVTVAPLALLLGMLYTLTHHARHHELTAIRAAGVSLWRVCVPYLGVGVLGGLGLFALNEGWVPRANELAQRVLNRRQAADPGALGAEWHPNLTFHNERDRRLWHIGAFNRQTGEMRRPHLEWTLEDGSRRRLVADAAGYTNGAWVFVGVRELLYPPQTTLPSYRGETNLLELAVLTETPLQINSEIRFTTLSNARAVRGLRLSLREIRAYQQLHPSLGSAERAKLQTQFHGRMAEVAKCLVVVLIAIPFGTPSGRRNVFVGVASSIFIGFAYYMLWSLGLAMGTGGRVPPWVAAWVPNVLFGAAGIWLIQRVR